MTPTQMLGLAKFASLKTSDLTPAVVSEIGKVLGLQIPEEKVSTVIDFVKKDDIDSLMEWAREPSRLEGLQKLLSGPQPGQAIIAVRCAHCKQLFEVEISGG